MPTKVHGIVKDPLGQPIIGTTCQIDVYDITDHGNRIGFAWSDPTDGTWEISTGDTQVDIKTLLLYSLNGTYKQLTDIAGAKFSKTVDEDALLGDFEDSPVSGLLYQTAKRTGFTNTTGGFTYRPGEAIQFFLGDITLGNLSIASRKMNPTSVIPGANGDHTNQTATNIATLLMSIDQNNDYSENIIIPKEIFDYCKGKSLDFSQAYIDFIIDPTYLDILSQFGDARTPPLEAAVQTHLEQTIISQSFMIMESQHIANSFIKTSKTDVDGDSFTVFLASEIEAASKIPTLSRTKLLSNLGLTNITANTVIPDISYDMNDTSGVGDSNVLRPTNLNNLYPEGWHF